MKKTPNSAGPRRDLFTRSGRRWAENWPERIPKTPSYVNRADDTGEFDWSHRTGRVLVRTDPTQWAARFAVHLATLGIFIRRARSKGGGPWRVWLPGVTAGFSPMPVAELRTYAWEFLNRCQCERESGLVPFRPCASDVLALLDALSAAIAEPGE